MKRLWMLLCLAALLAGSAAAESAPALPQCRTVEEVEALIRWPDETGERAPVERGVVRYISQAAGEDPLFRAEDWYGGEPGSELDLTLERDRNGKPYTYFARNMCTRAIYSMVLSYLGVDMTPGGMSAMLEKRSISDPYHEITALLPGIESVTFSTHAFQSMFEAYQTDSRYSPVYVYFRKKSGVTHALLVVAKTDGSRYIAVDPGYHELDGVPVRVYTFSFDKNFREILNSDFRREQAGSRILGFYQWRLTGG